MTTELQGELRGEGLRIGIVVARFNEVITRRLLEGATAALSRHHVRDEDVTVAMVPGSFEIPLAARRMAMSGRYDAVVCLGAVIRGETDHYTHIAGRAARGIADAALEADTPVIFGVLTTDTVQQAIERAGGERGEFVERPLTQHKARPDDRSTGPSGGNSGYSAGLAAIEMANLLQALDSA